MASQNEILTYIIEHLGIPLMGSLRKVGGGHQQDAEFMAKILSSSVELGVAISSKMNTPSDEGKAEALRFKMTSIASHALSERVKMTGAEPDDEDIQSLKAAIDSIMIFAEHFSLDDQAIKYLSKYGLEDSALAQASQITIIEALMPVIAVMKHEDRGLFTNIADRLAQEADDLSNQAKEKYELKNAVNALLKQRVLALLSESFASIYKSLMSDGQTLSHVWQEFDQRKGMIVLLLDFFMSGENTIKTQSSAAKEVDDSASGSGNVSKPQVAAPPQAPKKPSPPVPKKAASPISAIVNKPQDSVKAQEKEQGDNTGAGQQAQDSEEGTAGSGSTPLSFFKKP